MIAGVDLAGWRELAATVRRASWEAQATISVSADGPQITVRPMLLGPSRVARPFTVAGDPVALLLSALAADTAATVAISLTRQGALPTKINIRGYAGPAPKMGVHLDVAGLVTPARLAAAADHVRRYSVILRTLAESSPVRLLLVTPDGSQPVHLAEPPPASLSSGSPSPGSSSVRFAGSSSVDAGGEVHAVWRQGARSTVTAADRSIVIDRPKQLFGTDRGPSPEECLLAALAAEIRIHTGGEVHVSARQDLRGGLGFDGAPVGLRDILVQCLDPQAAIPAPGPVLELLRQPTDVSIEIENRRTPDAP
ncbi:putative OsmC-like protein [Actinoplanes campanulatus]|uniref:Putative OsmC-like protein n=1 Tax=Actinoplanes campanulatus TaxID=113559 RepID=A0A7W5AFR7_9ACTN|nr:hypothetical protein [Actinoplanes campanulatus]MBB3095506.1 putative OsmC-like protein [Actinoplanes campanulatus]GGN09492.1 hypothetical protein GCM10010109_18790 [Actinoplanes campanulatus]GID36397.1 hypothetical protein Aca09nite_29030 [Actinoplanes campanulatus]